MPQDQNITIGNINSIAEVVASLEDTDFIYVLANKEGANTFCKIQKGLLLAGLSGVTPSSGGMSADVYQAIQDNVDTLRSKINGLIGDLATLAFSGSKTQTIGTFTWPDSESGGGGETPSASPSLTSPAANTTKTITLASDASSDTATISVKGTNLSSALTIEIGGTNASRFSATVTSGSLTPSSGNVNATVTITYTHANSVNSDITEYGTLTISGGGLASSRTVALQGKKLASGSVVTANLDSPESNATVSIIVAANSTSNTATVYFKGSGFSNPLTITKNGGAASKFSLSHDTLTAAQVNAGTNVTITYENDTSPSVDTTENITLQIIGEVNRGITVYGTKKAASVGPVTGVNVNKSGCRNCEISDNTVNGVLASGTNYVGTVVVYDTPNLKTSDENDRVSFVIPDDGVTVKINGVTKTPGTDYTFSGNVLTIPASNINGNISIDVIAESPVIARHKISSGGGKYSTEDQYTQNWCYNDAYILIPYENVNIKALKWKHCASSGVVTNAYLSTPRTYGDYNVNKTMVNDSVNEQVVELSTLSSQSHPIYLTASYALNKIKQCYVYGYEGEDAAAAAAAAVADENNESGILLFDGQYAVIQEFQA